ncbi:hypothetical protein WA556_001648 [Blastocystis sp. ATCC 50177/Nand II]
MNPPSKRRKQEESMVEEVPLASVLEWFDTTKKPTTILCRETESKRINDFLSSCLDNEKGGSLYICGSPGIGKSLLMNNVLSALKTDRKGRVKIVTVNAMTLQKNQDLYSILGEQLLKQKQPWEKAKQSLEDTLFKKTSRKKAPLILCIDEIDKLLTKERSIVYDLFEWPYSSSNPIIVIGIANSIDLVEKSLPLLKIGHDRKPDTFVFPSYTAYDLKAILVQRVALCTAATHTASVLFHPTAVELLTKKVAEMGDARRLLDVCKAALQAACPAGVVSSSTVVTLPVVSRTLFEFFRSGQASRVEELPRLAQVVLACLCGMVQEAENRGKETGKRKGVTATQLREAYLQVCKRVVGGSRPNVAEFNQLLDQLVHNGICKMGDGKRGRPMDRAIVMLLPTSDLVEELGKDADLVKVVKLAPTFMK